MFDDLYSCRTVKELRDKYRAYTKEWHPDRYMQEPDKLAEAEENMKLLNSIYEECSIKLRDAEKFDTMSDIDIVSFCKSAGIKIVKEEARPRRDPNNYYGWWYSPDTKISDIVEILRESVRDIDDYNIEITNPYNGDTIFVRVLSGITNENVTFCEFKPNVKEVMAATNVSYRLRNIFKSIIMAAREYNYYYEGEVYFKLKLQIGKTPKTPYKYKKAKVKKSRIYHDREYYRRELVRGNISFAKVPPRFRDVSMVETAINVATSNLKDVFNPKLEVYKFIDEDLLVSMISNYPTRIKTLVSTIENFVKKNPRAKLNFDVEKTILNLWRAAVNSKFSLCVDAPEIVKQEQDYYTIKERQDKRSIAVLSVMILDNKSDALVAKSVTQLSKLLMMYDIELKDLVGALIMGITDKEKFKNIPKDLKKSERNVSKFLRTLVTATLYIKCNLKYPNYRWDHEEGQWVQC